MALQIQLKKSVQVINYFARLTSSKKIGKVKLLALIYLTDRFHLRKFGQTLTNDQYIALENGPVPTTIKKIVEQHFGLISTDECYLIDFIDRPAKDQNIRSVEETDMSIFSAEEIETVEFVAANFGRMGRNDLIALAQSFTEWQKQSSKIIKDCTDDIKIDLLDFFIDSPSENKFCAFSEGHVAQTKKIYLENR